jgi:hypothetical protein
MKNTFVQSIAMILMVSFMLGCASTYVLNDSKKRIAKKDAIIRNDEKAIKAIDRNGVAGIGIDISNLRALKEQPLTQLGAAIIDAGMGYGLYRAIESLNITQNDSGTSIEITGTDNNVSITSGDNNTETQGNPTEEVKSED